MSGKENREVYPADFDEDLSELEEDNEQENDDGEQSKNEKEDCTCGGEDLECDCQYEDVNTDEDHESERSYNEFDIDYYFVLKEERENRKWQKLLDREDKQEQLELEMAKEEEVRATERALYRTKKRKAIAIESLAGQQFNLFCSAHVEYFDHDLSPTKRVDFHYFDADNYSADRPKLEGEAEMLDGLVYLDEETTCCFGPFRPPKYASRKAIKVKSKDDKYDLFFTFLGNGHLKLRVSRDMVFMGLDNPDSLAHLSTAPEVFEFVGIWFDWREWQERREKSREKSPRETWFEMSHPMGWWNEWSHF